MPGPISHLDRTGAGEAAAQFASDVRYYMLLEPRQLPSRYLYDPLGSALFDAICHLPWYGITRAEERLLRAHAAEIFRRVQPLATIVELGPGNGHKLHALIDSAESRPARLDVHLIDVSRDALARSTEKLVALDGVRTIAHQDRYESGLASVGRDRRSAGRTLVLFLGSNIGNFDPPAADAFLRTIRSAMVRGDALLLGADLVKPERQLLLAYDDPLGVTAAFNRNLLVRINRELGGNFALEHFSHRAVWNAAASRVEMHLVAEAPDHVIISAAAIEFDMSPGEPIWTESSYKYQPGAIVDTAQAASFRLTTHWVNEEAMFALLLFEAI